MRAGPRNHPAGSRCCSQEVGKARGSVHDEEHHFFFFNIFLFFETRSHCVTLAGRERTRDSPASAS